MKKVIYIYVLDTLADWEIGYILQAVQMQSMLKASQYLVKTVGRTKAAIKTLGGLNLIPDCSLEEIGEEEIAALLLPGAQTWHEEAQKPILERVVSCFEKGIIVGAICGATVALAELGILDNHLHTSNSLEYLCGCSKNYAGQALYQEEISVTDGALITASSAGGLLWAKQIVEALKMYAPETTEAWYKYYLTGDAKYYMELLVSME